MGRNWYTTREAVNQYVKHQQELLKKELEGRASIIAEKFGEVSLSGEGDEKGQDLRSDIVSDTLKSASFRDRISLPQKIDLRRLSRTLFSIAGSIALVSAVMGVSFASGIFVRNFISTFGGITSFHPTLHWEEKQDELPPPARSSGRNPLALFTDEVKTLRDYLTSRSSMFVSPLPVKSGEEQTEKTRAIYVVGKQEGKAARPFNDFVVSFARLFPGGGAYARALFSLEDQIGSNVALQIRKGVGSREYRDTGKDIPKRSFYVQLQPKQILLPNIISDNIRYVKTAYIEVKSRTSDLFQDLGNSWQGVWSNLGFMRGQPVVEGVSLAALPQEFKLAFTIAADRTVRDLRQFAAIAGEEMALIGEAKQVLSVWWNNLAELAYEKILGIPRIVREEFKAAGEAQPQELTKEVSLPREERPLTGLPSTETRVREVTQVVERKERFVPADFALVKQDILAGVESLNTAIRDRFQSDLSDLRSLYSRLSSANQSQTRIITLTQKIDTLGEATLSNITFSGTGNQFNLIDADIPDAITVTGSQNLGALTLSGNLTFSGTRATTTIPSSLVNSFAIATSSASTPFLSFDTANYRIGVGTSSPGTTFSIAGSLLVSADTNIGGALTVSGTNSTST